MGPTIPTRMLRSNFINDFKREMTTHWRALSHSQTYKGQGWLPIRRKRRIFKPSIGSKATKNFFLSISGNNIETLSRMARALTGHAPTGEYRQRFHPDLPTYCKHCGPATEHTRAHVFTSCPSYVSLAPQLLIGKETEKTIRSGSLSSRPILLLSPSAICRRMFIEHTENFCNPVASCHFSRHLVFLF